MVSDEPKDLGRRWWQAEVWDRLAGREVRFVRPVDRGDFSVAVGATGRIRTAFLDSKGGLVLAVALDLPPVGAEPFEGEVHWREGVNLLEVETDLVLT